MRRRKAAHSLIGVAVAVIEDSPNYLLNRHNLQRSSLATLAGCQTFCTHIRRNIWRSLIIASLLSLFLSHGRAVETGLSETNLIPENTRLWTESMLWNEQITLSSGLGYNNNVLLSAFNPQGSPFFINGLDLMVVRLPLDGWKVVGSITGDDIRYWHNVGADREDTFIASLRVERELPDGWQAGLEARGLYEDEVLDISTGQGTPATALVEGYGITGTPSLRKDLMAGLWLKLEVPVTRWYFKAPLDDYWEFGPVVTAGYDFGKRADVAVSYGATYQPHDQWGTLDVYGRQLPQLLLLEIFQHQVEIAWHQYWDAQRRWRSSTRLIFDYREDNGGGYFNNYQYQAVQDLRWQTSNWEIKGSAQLVYEDYPIQTIAYHNSETLHRNLLDLSLEAEHRLFKSLKGFGKVEYQRAISNEVLNAGDYKATTVSGGIRWEF